LTSSKKLKDKPRIQVFRSESAEATIHDISDPDIIPLSPPHESPVRKSLKFKEMMALQKKLTKKKIDKDKICEIIAQEAREIEQEWEEKRTAMDKHMEECRERGFEKTTTTV
jgi:hypothetical protein